MAKGLGKDFSSLIPEDMLSEALAVGNSSEQIEKINIVKIKPDPNQPRKNFDEEALNELAGSIKQHGILQPIIVAKKSADYIIIAGERRFRAAQLLGLKELPAIIRSFGEQEKLEISLIENVQREDLGKLELAAAYLKLHDQFNLEYKEIGLRVGRSESAVVNIMRLLKLPQKAKDALNSGVITEGHARQIVAIKDNEAEQLKLLELIIKHGWTVRQAEQYVVGLRQQTKKEDAKALTNTKSETPETKKLSTFLKTPVKVRRLAKGGQILINYKDDEHLKSLTEKLID
jgi:ParB family chromosome partitioning protein